MSSWHEKKDKYGLLGYCLFENSRRPVLNTMDNIVLCCRCPFLKEIV